MISTQWFFFICFPLLNISNKKLRPILCPALKTPVSLSFYFPGLHLFGLSVFACEQTVDGGSSDVPSLRGHTVLEQCSYPDICFWALTQSHVGIWFHRLHTFPLVSCPSLSLLKVSSPFSTAPSPSSRPAFLCLQFFVSYLPFRWERWSVFALLGDHTCSALS